ncbi:MAG TPA: arylamine N-acetyltransferase [Casimicrobiaceae bacterium]|nr:arylamine N-acetyltransferase [Casimicrobiaceae bacterium]
MTTSIDLDAYFARIGWGGSMSPTFDTLAGLLRAHMAAIPFENLDVLLGRPVRLDLEGLQDKLVRSRRGGYCFEHGTLFAAALEGLGFRPARHTARVVLIATRETSPRTHMFLVVPLAEGRFVVDPGFGTLAPTTPVPLVDAGTEPRAQLSHWMARDGGYWVLRARTAEKVVDAWVTTLDLDNPIDFELGNYYTSTNPASTFVNRIMMRALTKNGRVGVMNRDVTVWSGSELRQTQLADRAALRALLLEHFGFDLPEVERMRVPSIPEWA